VVPAARVLMSQLDLIPLSSGLLDEAADVGEPLLRTLDAIHLAGALSIQADLTAFVAYDLDWSPQPRQPVSNRSGRLPPARSDRIWDTRDGEGVPD